MPACLSNPSPRKEGRLEESSAHGLRSVLGLVDLAAMSTSSVGPAFSVAAAIGVMAGFAGYQAIAAILILGIPFLFSAAVFRLLNRHMPHAGASFHWTSQVLGAKVGRLQAWVLILAYFASIPPIVIPAGSYTLALVNPALATSPLWTAVVGIGWAIFASIPLLSGIGPTAKLTKTFLVIEVAVLVLFAAIGAGHLGQAHPLELTWFLPSLAHWRGLLLAIVVAATILDGWEIDSYASEESKSPRRDPGTGGIIGLLGAMTVYLVLLPLIFSEIPLHQIAGSTDPLAAWAGAILPGGASTLVLIPVIASTAGSLWLTTYILSRALYAMGREGVIHPRWARLNRSRVPLNAVVILGGVSGVVAFQIAVPSAAQFFEVLLSAAGFFLIAEFFLDSLTATVFVWKPHVIGALEMKVPHIHWGYRIASPIALAMFGAVLLAYLWLAPQVIAWWADWAILVLAAPAAALMARRNSRGESTIPLSTTVRT